ncbi:MAG: hydrogenase formation protein HypD [Desulfurococcaceae archaeon]|nr:hydrogenase formation protein HypD [Desulfurococcaceae archaeon]
MSYKLYVELERDLRYNRRLAEALVKKIHEAFSEYTKIFGVDRLKIMDFCGTHEWSITYYGIRSLVPSELELVAGPGCPVCVIPSHYIEESIKLAFEGITIYCYGDVYKLRARRPVNGAYSLSEAKSLGGDVKVVQDIISAAKDATRHGKPSVFLAVGFETAAPAYAWSIIKGLIPRNLKLLSLVKLTPPAMFYALEVAQEKPTEPPISGVIAPGHVSTITGAKAWTPISEHFNIPVVVSGFEPLDILASILEILSQLVRGEAKTVIEYRRGVTWNGDVKAQAAIARVFEIVDDAWRGIGFLPKSGLRLREEFKQYDALYEYGVKELKPSEWVKDNPAGCRCAEVVLGKAYPTQCPLFMKACTPQRPIGPCMVSIEGTCAIWARFGSRDLLSKVSVEIKSSGIG